MKRNRFFNILLVLTLTVILCSCSKKDDYTELYSAEIEQAKLNEYLDYLAGEGLEVKTTDSGVYYVVISEGEGDVPKAGDKVSVVYNAYFIDGERFASSGDPEIYGYFTYTHKIDNMIKGWEDGIETMKKGGSSLLIIPSDLAYGPTGYYDIPPYSSILYEIYVYDIESSTAE